MTITAQSSIEDVFAPTFGGPSHIFTNKSFSEALAEHANDPGFKPENFEEHHGIWNKVFQAHLVSDGIFDVSDLPFVFLPDAEHLDYPITDEGLAFVQQHGAENIYIANGYQVVGMFLFAGQPRELRFKDVAQGDWGRGACARLHDLPKAILVVEEDD